MWIKIILITSIQILFGISGRWSRVVAKFGGFASGVIPTSTENVQSLGLWRFLSCKRASTLKWTGNEIEKEVPEGGWGRCLTAIVGNLLSRNNNMKGGKGK